MMNLEEILRKLQKPKGKVDVVIDTDTFNEIDDQFALSYLIKNEDKLNLKGIYAAPFTNSKSTGPEDGMEKSYNEIMRILELIDREDYKKITFKGSRSYLKSEHEGVESPAARNLIELAMERDSGNPLYVVGIATITDVASAILLEPKIIDKIVLIWLGGHAHDWPVNDEFNLSQDIAAARIVFGSGIPLVQLPCMGVVSSFTTTEYELTHWLEGKNKLCDYLLTTTINEAKKGQKSSCWSRVIWDVTAVAWLLEDEGKFMHDRLEYSPIPEYDNHYAFSKSRHMIKYVYEIRRDFLFEDLFKKISK
ncbi:MAG: nucleoside hydrolase [Oscillospiraceae bacterium]|nr:nucleoside hydrolase [Oscillospiraceae bacterium]